MAGSLGQPLMSVDPVSVVQPVRIADARNAIRHVFVRNLTAATTTLVSQTPAAGSGNRPSGNAQDKDLLDKTRKIY